MLCIKSKVYVCVLYLKKVVLIKPQCRTTILSSISKKQTSHCINLINFENVFIPLSLWAFYVSVVSV